MTDCHIINPPLTQITNQYLPRHHLFPNTNPNPNLLFSLFRTNPLRNRHTMSGHHCTRWKAAAYRALVGNFITVVAPVVRDSCVFFARPATTTTLLRTCNSREQPAHHTQPPLAALLVANTTMLDVVHHYTRWSSRVSSSPCILQTLLWPATTSHSRDHHRISGTWTLRRFCRHRGNPVTFVQSLVAVKP